MLVPQLDTQALPASTWQLLPECLVPKRPSTPEPSTQYVARMHQIHARAEHAGQVARCMHRMTTAPCMHRSTTALLGAPSAPNPAPTSPPWRRTARCLRRHLVHAVDRGAAQLIGPQVGGHALGLGCGRGRYACGLGLVKAGMRMGPGRAGMACRDGSWPHGCRSTAVGHTAVGHMAVGHMAVGHMAVGHMAVGHMAFGHMAVGHLAERGSCPLLKEERPRIESGEPRAWVEDHLVVEVGDGGAVGALHVVRVDLERRRDVHLPGSGRA